jgi:hypothetical protein
MTKFVFRRFVACENGQMARLETEKTGIPINIFAENDTDYDLQNGEKCYVTVYGIPVKTSLAERRKLVNSFRICLICKQHGSRPPGKGSRSAAQFRNN